MRRLNYTGRVRIPHHLVHTRGTVFSDEQSIATVELDLATLDLDPGASVFVEFYRRTAFVRHSAGTVARPTPISYQFEDFGQPAGVLVRVKVVSVEADSAGRLLAVADRVRIGWEDTTAGRAGSLLPFRAERLGSLVWDMDLDDQPVVLMNESLPDWNGFARSQEFVAIAYPEIVRRVAMWTARSIDEEGPAAEWREFLAELTGTPVPSDPDTDEDELGRWAGECVRRFAEQHRVLDLVMVAEEVD